MAAFARFLVAACLLVSCAAPAAADPVTIRIGAPDQSVGTAAPSGGIGLITYVDSQKLLETEFARDDVKIEWHYFKGAGPAINEALANKQLDIVYLGDLAAIIGRSNGLPTRFLVPARGSNAFLAVAPDSGIARLEDLKGKRVTVFKGTAYHLSLVRALAKAGLTEKDIQLFNLDWNAALSALAARQLDADWAGAQALTLADKGLAKIVVSTRDLGPAFTIQAGFLGTEDFIAAHPDLTQRLVNVLVKANHEISSRPGGVDSFLKATSERSGIPVALGKAEYDGIDAKFRFSPLIDEFIVNAFEAGVRDARELGLIRKPFEVKDWLEGRFVSRAIDDLKLADAWPALDKDGKPKAK